MRNLNLLFIVVFFVSISVNAQKKDANIKKLPTSIYTFNPLGKDLNGISAINKKLNLKSFDFVFVDIVDIDLNQYSIDIKNVYKVPSEFIYDDLRRYQNSNLLKGFLRKNDPTRWNLHHNKKDALPPKG